MPANRPNLLLLMTDQHSPHVSGCYGDRIVSTPNIDALASRGVTFENAYCNSPLCCPSRMSFMTGRHPSEIGCLANGARLSSETPTFAHALGQAGYRVVLCGRMHFNGPDQRHGFEERIHPDGGGESAGMLKGTEAFGPKGIKLSGPGRNHYLRFDEDVAKAACDWLAGPADEDERPFCLVVGFLGPHCPFVCPKDLFGKYWERVEVPRYDDAHWQDMHPYNRRFRERSGLTEISEHEIRRTRAAYYGMVEFDDRLVGEVLASLGKSPRARETAVLYTSDHGEMAGEHGMWWKKSFYEASVGIPLVASWPGHFPQGTREGTPVSLINLAPTLCDLAAAPAIPGMTAPSIRPLFEGRAAPELGPVFSEVYNQERKDGPSGGPARMMRQGPWKCVYYHGERPSLFQLEEDPDELNDRAGDPACCQVLEEMQREILAGWDPEKILAEEGERLKRIAFRQKAPGDVKRPQVDSWKGPKDYGFVEPV